MRVNDAVEKMNRARMYLAMAIDYARLGLYSSASENIDLAMSDIEIADILLLDENPYEEPEKDA